MQSIGDTDYQFDQDGFLQTIGDKSYVYSAVGELLSTSSSDGQQTNYNYDGTARRTARADANGTIEYLYGNPDNYYEITAVRRADGQIDEYCYDPMGILQCIKRDGQNYYVACDNLGSPKTITDSSGTTIKVLEYDSYGRLIADSNPDFTIAIGYAGGLDDQNGLIRFGARDYDPVTGRWTAKDPILFEGGQANLYVYVGNDPVNNTDPSGHELDWQKFEEELGKILNTAKNTTMDERRRIVDFLTKDGQAWEAKSGKYLYRSSQLRDFIEKYGGKFNLVINKTTGCAKPLLKELEAAGAGLYRMVNGKLEPIVTNGGKIITTRFMPIIMIIPDDPNIYMFYGTREEA